MKTDPRYKSGNSEYVYDNRKLESAAGAAVQPNTLHNPEKAHACQRPKEEVEVCEQAGASSQSSETLRFTRQLLPAFAARRCKQR